MSGGRPDLQRPDAFCDLAARGRGPDPGRDREFHHYWGYLGYTYGCILVFRLVGERGTLSKWPWNRSPDIFFVSLCSTFRAGAIRMGPGTDFGRNRPQVDQSNNVNL